MGRISATELILVLSIVAILFAVGKRTSRSSDVRKAVQEFRTAFHEEPAASDTPIDEKIVLVVTAVALVLVFVLLVLNNVQVFS